jgi:hypothetical protein
MILLTEANVLWHSSVAVQVSVTVPPQTPGVAVNVEAFDVPVIWQPSDRPLLNGMVLEAGMLPQATVIFESGVIVGNVAGLTVIVRVTGARILPHTSVAVQVSVAVPPQAPGIINNPEVHNVEGFEVPDILQLPSIPLLNGSVLGAGSPPQATVISTGAVIVGNVAGLTVMILLTEVNALWQASVAVQVSVTVPPQASGIVDNVEAFEVPEIRQPPPRPLLNGRVLAAGSPPQATVISAGAVIVGNVAGLTVMVLLTEANALRHASVAVQVSVTVPPQAPGIVVNVEAFDVPVIWQPYVRPLL